MPKSSVRSTPATAENSVEELRALLAEAEKALSATGEQSSEEVTALRERVRAALDTGREATRHLVAKGREYARQADEFVHERPYVAMGVAAGVGVLLGALVTHRCCRTTSA